MNKSLSALILTNILFASASYCAAAPGKAAARPKPADASLTLAQNGQTKYVIAVANDAIPAEKTAANELRDYLQQISGAKFAVKSEGAVAANAPQILVGSGKRVKSLLPKQNWKSLESDGIVVKTSGRNLILAGGRPRGSLYAVYSFLEDSLGVRWWTPSESKVPNLRTLKVSPQSLVYTPKLRTREVFYNSVQQDAKFATRMKNNGHHQTQTVEWGGHNSILGFVHTFDKLLPPEKYFKDHPEWYSDLDNGGKPCTANSKMPGPQQSQLSLTNEEARKELTKNALAWIRENPEAGMISISQNDNFNKHTGAADMELEAREGSPAGPLLHFVNAVAADIEKEFPGFLVETLAYLYTRQPPKYVRPRSNVVIRLCSIEADFSRPLTSEANKAFQGDVLGWKAIAPRLFIWDYTTNFGNVIMPHPNLQVLGDNIRFFTANNTIGLFEQGDAYSNGSGNFVALHVWLLSHLMWNPALDQKKLEDDFLKGYYGAAAPHLRAYLDTIKNAFAKKGGPLSTFQNDHSYLNLEAMNAATRHFRLAAAAVASDATLSSRVRRERLALDHAWIMRSKIVEREAQMTGVASEGPQDLSAFIIDFVATARAFKTSQRGEAQPFENYAAQLLDRASVAKTAPAPLPDFARNKKSEDIIDGQESDFFLYRVGDLTKAVPDAAASNGQAATMTGHSNEWAIQMFMAESDEFLGKGEWRCYAYVRVQPKAGAAPGPVISAGIYDVKNKKILSQVSKTIAEVGGEQYQAVDLGKHALHSQMYFFVAPPNREDVEGIYLDRFIMVREPASP